MTYLDGVIAVCTQRSPAAINFDLHVTPYATRLFAPFMQSIHMLHITPYATRLLAPFMQSVLMLAAFRPSLSGLLAF